MKGGPTGAGAHIFPHVAATPSNAAHRVLGCDLGGTKLLGGVVDDELEVYDRVHRGGLGLSEQALIDTIVEAAQELIERNPDVQAAGFGIPSLIDQRTGVA